MEKQKITFENYHDMCNTLVLRGKDGVEVQVRDHIPYAEKTEAAREMAELLIMIHDDSCCYISYEETAMEIYEIVKHYTDIDVTDAPVQDVVDFVMNNELWKKLYDEVIGDWDIVWDMYSRICQSVTDTFDDDRSLRKAVKTSFPFLFSGEDVTQSLARAETAGGTLFEALSALREEKKRDAQKMDEGLLKVNGNLLNFAKRE